MRLLEFALVLFATNLLGGLAGYGGSILALPIVLWIVPDRDLCVSALILTGFSQSLQLLLMNHRHVDRPALLRMLVACACGVPFGWSAAKFLPEHQLLIALGAVLLFSGLVPFFREAPSRRRPFVEGVLLWLGGAIHGAFATGGGPVVMAARRMLPTKDAFRATLFAFWVSLNVVVITLFAVTGRIPQRSLPWALASIPCVLFSGWLADRIALRIREEDFRRLISLMLVLAGLITIARNVG